MNKKETIEMPACQTCFFHNHGQCCHAIARGNCKSLSDTTELLHYQPDSPDKPDQHQQDPPRQTWPTPPSA